MARLSGREREILDAVLQGKHNREIAAALGLSVRTVERHIHNLYRKIDARGRADATAYAGAAASPNAVALASHQP